jgi:pyruvate/2-oxoacid:ferredoxin oxidoreductase alpha subunit/pyruvate/2-oxoacid:ferredoxin oxidoreductase beta subunit/ferredoxin/Pyruvate/2-oxoacid:ferredoxin oxidoreductase gamma subunit
MAEGGSPGSVVEASITGVPADLRQWRHIKGDPEVFGVWLRDCFYPLARRDNLGLGFQEGLLGAGYAAAWQDRSDWLEPLPRYLANFFRQKPDRTQFYLVSRNLPGNAAQPVPLFTLAKTDAGQAVVLELNPDFEDRQEIYLALAWYSLVQANAPYIHHRFDAFGDFMRLGAFSQVDRHSTELSRKHLSQRIYFAAEGCTHCLKCATSCSEMQVRLTSEGLTVLGPAENYCTVCRLCLEHCPHLQEVRQEGLPPDRKAAPAAHFTGGAAIYLTQAAVQKAQACFQGLADSRGRGDNWQISPLYQGASWQEAEPKGPEIRQYSLEDQRPGSPYKPLLITVYPSPPGWTEPPLMILRLLSRVAVFLTTATGEIEAELLRRLDSLGVLYQGVVDGEKFGSLGDMPLAPKLQRLNRLAPEADLVALVTARQVDVVLTPMPEALPAPVSSYFLQVTGNLANLLAPQIFQAFTFSPEPLLNELRELCLEVFPRYPELLAAEAARARTYLADLPRYGAEIHARYRTWGMAPGHSACPTCAELQTLAVPLYMAMVLSLARGQVPQVTFTCETGCMSETLNKVKEVAQKVKGGRTVFGGGFAFGEAAAMSEDWAMARGVLPQGRRYVVSQSGDGGAVIGLPAWLNALRQRAFLIKDREAQVLHFINVTDTQVYSNTGGESSATSMLGMSTLTTPLGRFLVGNQRIQWQLINLAAEFPGVLVGSGHSAHKYMMQEFWAEADRLGRSAIRWDVTPCPETGKFFGEDPDRLARIMAYAGFLPEVVFVGRLRKRVAPINPRDRHQNWREWTAEPQPIYYWLSQDPRYRPLIRRDPVSGDWEPINPAVRAIIAQLESFRDRLNRQIDLENRLVREAEEYTAEFFRHLQAEWQKNRYVPEEFPYHFLFNDQGELKPEFGPALPRDFLEAVLGLDYVMQYVVARDEQLTAEVQTLQTSGRAEKATAPAGGEVLPRPEPLAALGTRASGYESVAAARQAEFQRLLDRLIDERALAKQAQISQYILRKELVRDFQAQGGIFSQGPMIGAELAPARREFRASIAALGEFALGVASLAGERGIALNRLFSQYFTAKGAWAGMAWQFGSSKRGTPVFSATFISHRPIQRKDALLRFPFYVLTVTNYGDLKSQPDVFYDHLQPQGYLIINTPRTPAAIHQELLAGYDDHTRQAVARAQAAPRGEAREAVSQWLFEVPYSALNLEQLDQVTKVLALAQARVITTDLDGIMAQVTGTSRAIANLVAVAPMMRALEILGLPVSFEADLPALTAGFPAAVKKNKQLAEQYLTAMRRAYQESQGFIDAPPPQLAPHPREPSADPGDYYLEMGGTLAGLVLSQLATRDHPLFYIGFPITPAGNPFYAMAQAYANGHPYIMVDENNPSEKVAAEKLLGVARTGGALPVTFTASQGWRLFAEIMPQLVGARLECLFVLAKRALAAPALNIEESHTDFMTFRDDGAIMLSPKDIQEFVPCLYLARLLTHFARLPVVASLGGITDTHKISLVKVPPDQQVQAWLARALAEVDFLEDKLLNRQGEVIVHGPSATGEVYQETQSEVEKAHALVPRVFPYAARLVEELTGYRFQELEVAATAEAEPLTTALVLTGSFYPNAEEAVAELAQEGWRELGAIAVRLFNPFPEEALAEVLSGAKLVTVMDRSNSFGSVPPLASRVITALARQHKGLPPLFRVLVGGLGGREITVPELKEIIKFSHLFLVPRPQVKPELRQRLLEGDLLLQGLLDERAALEARSLKRHTRLPAAARSEAQARGALTATREKLAQALIRGDYLAALANYGPVEFINPKEVWEETRLIKKLIIRLEMLLARELISQGQADWRAAVTLLEYGVQPGDFAAAVRAFNSLITAAPASTAWALYQLGEGYGHKFRPCSLTLTAPAAPTPAPLPGLEAPEIDEPAQPVGAVRPEVPFSPAEAALLEKVMRTLIAESARWETLRNPGDLEREALEILARDPASQLFGQADAATRLAYQEVYTGVIDRTLAEGILGQHYAPELKEIFAGEGLRALELMVQATVAYFGRGQGDRPPDPEEVQRQAAGEVERYLREDVYPRYRRAPGFYHDYYRAWVAPDLKQALVREVAALNWKTS